MTPEKAQELRRGDFGSSEWCQIVGNLEAGVDQLGGPYITGTPGDFALVEAAPALAETVAGLRGEYAVQLAECNNAFVKRFKNGKLGSGPAMHAEWCATFSQAENLENDFAHQFPSAPRTFIVARYVSAEPWEVIS